MELSYKYDKCNFFAKFLAESKYFSSPAKLPIENVWQMELDENLVTF